MGISNTLITSGDGILEFIPQRSPMVMIDKLISSDEKQTTSGLLINQDNIFVKSGFFQEPGLIENIAQTAASRVGYICKQENKDVPLGFIGGVKNLKIKGLPKVNSHIQTTIVVDYQILGASIISGKIIDENNDVLAECEMKIFLQKEE